MLTCRGAAGRAFPRGAWERGLLSIVLGALALVSGCAKQRDNTADRNGTEILPILQPKSGGEMVLIPAGSFTMGDASGRPDEAPHQVSVDSFYIDKSPV